MALTSAAAGPDGAQFLQQVETVADTAVGRWIDKREIRDVPQPERHHAQDNLGQVGPQDFRRREQPPG